MSTVVQEAPLSPTKAAAPVWLSSVWLRRLVIVAVGCVVMAAVGSSLASYLDTTAATGADIQPADAPPPD